MNTLIPLVSPAAVENEIPRTLSPAGDTAFPSIFVSHGAPTLLLEDVPARHFLTEFGVALGRPRAIVTISAHDTADMATVVSTAPLHHAIHDFGGFPEELYRMDYMPAGEVHVARDIAARLRKAGFNTAESNDSGIDHGIWVPLKLMYPAADIPLVRISLDLSLNNAQLIALGKTLEEIRKDGVLIMATGSLTHNLREYRHGALHDAPPQYVLEFSAWVTDKLSRREDAALCDWENQAPYARRAHPTTEHFLPLLVAYGAGKQVHVEHMSFTHSVLAMHAFSFR